MNIEDAELLIIRWIREKPKTEHSNYGYDVYLSNVIRWHLHESGERDQHAVVQSIPNLWPTFVAAAWELCRRGVIRPGVRQIREQSTDQGSAGEGYSITPFGAQWAAESDRDDFVPTEPQRFAQMLAPYVKRFGARASTSVLKRRSGAMVRTHILHAVPCAELQPSQYFSLRPSPNVARSMSLKHMHQQRAAAGFRTIYLRTYPRHFVKSSIICRSC